MTALAALDLRRAFWLAVGVGAGTVWTSILMIGFVDGDVPARVLLAWFSLWAAFGCVAAAAFTWSAWRHGRTVRA